MPEFDRVVHIRNSKTGKIKENHYRQVCEDGNVFLERDGIRYYEDGTPVVKPEAQLPQLDIVEVDAGLPIQIVAEDDLPASKKRK